MKITYNIFDKIEDLIGGIMQFLLALIFIVLPIAIPLIISILLMSMGI